jgi:tRNA-dihydrouridine synthase
VRCADSDLELRAVRILEEAGGRHVHIHGRIHGRPAHPEARA